jgi:hypothetical protein
MDGEFWFRPKAFGYGATPDSWEGWMVVAAYGACRSGDHDRAGGWQREEFRSVGRVGSRHDGRNLGFDLGQLVEN